jgi:hypothetical protein
LHGSAISPLLASGYKELAPVAQTWRFRVADVIAQVDGDSLRIFASHHVWKPQEQCFAVRVSQLDTRLGELERSAGPGEWHTIFESRPCTAGWCCSMRTHCCCRSAITASPASKAALRTRWIRRRCTARRCA